MTNAHLSKSRSTGPRTVEGRTRVSLNAVRHGLSSRSIILPGEDSTEYVRRLDAIFEALSPVNEAEAELVGLIGDDLFKMERLNKNEAGLGVARIEDLLAHTDFTEKTNTTTKVLLAMARAIDDWEAEPFPLERNQEFIGRLNELDSASSLVSDINGFPLDCVAELQMVISPLLLHGSRVVASADQEHFKNEVSRLAKVLMGKLLDHGAALEAEQEQLRQAIATISLPDAAELAKLGKYRRMLDDSLTKRLQALEQLRKLRPEQAADEAQNQRSREFRLRLRVIK